ncbi:LysR family transcriptional regulator [Oceanicoccus sagamiensis]|uniref:HTH lysR-type domain-containing protein n=1 Tax=Oceanicoccus sagamiensis TaxID=716816 RepID=A0A1X9NEZ1_9GAMM|nr:LysR family transcriptional regulator [Oceanicoccus sagamiensis]ARN75731.1 hypothetical protein BST96_17430 [Oceanicoccus sagamiensis]
MDIKQLRYFSAIVRMGSFRKAAEAVHISQPALSLSIKGLESKLGVQLLERGSGKLVPTTFGKSLFEHAQKMDSLVQNALDDINQLKGIGEGQVRLGISPFVATTEMGSIIGRFISRYPRIQILTCHGIYSWSMSQLISGDIDFFFAEIPVDTQHPDAVHHELFRMPYKLVVGKQHPLAQKKQVSLEQVLDYRLAYGKDWAADIHGWSSAFAGNDIKQPESFIDVASSEFYVSLAKECDIIILNPMTSYIRQQVERGDLVKLNIPGTDFHTVIALVHRKQQSFSPAGQFVFDEIKEQISLLTSQIVG